MIKKAFLNDKFILGLIVLNAITIFIHGFPELSSNLLQSITHIDSFISFLFVVEIIIKVRHFGWKTYISSNWNRFDFIIIILAIPSIFAVLLDLYFADLSFLLVLRVSRVFKFFRFLKFIPGINHLLRGIQRALRDSVLVLIGFVVYNFVISIFSCYLFRNVSPEYFGDPLRSLYSIFRIFTVEGWYEIPDSIALVTSPTVAAFSKLFFVIVLLTGGIFGLSLVNSIFVDAMVSDNTDELERKVDIMNEKIDRLMKEREE